MYLELIDIVQIVTNLSWVMRFTFYYECTKLNNLRAKYLFSPDIRREPNVFNFVNIMQTNDPETIGNLAKFILHGLKLYILHTM